MQLVYGTQVVGTAVLSVPTSVPGIASFPVVKVPLAAPVTPYAPPSTRTLTFQGAYPPVKFPQPGIVTYAADKLDLLLTIERADGTPVPMSQDVPETDTDPASKPPGSSACSQLRSHSAGEGRGVRNGPRGPVPVLTGLTIRGSRWSR